MCFELLAYTTVEFKVSLLRSVLLVVLSSFNNPCKLPVLLLSLSVLGFGVIVLLGHLLI